MTKAHYYSLLIYDETIVGQSNLEYSLRSDEFYDWDEITYTTYDTGDTLDIPYGGGKARIIRNNVQKAFVDSSTMVSFTIAKVEILEIKSSTGSFDELTIRLSSTKRNKE